MMTMMIMLDYHIVLNLNVDTDYYLDIVKEDDDLLVNKLAVVVVVIEYSHEQQIHNLHDDE
jgi:hypothetical protein